MTQDTQPPGADQLHRDFVAGICRRGVCDLASLREAIELLDPQDTDPSELATILTSAYRVVDAVFSARGIPAPPRFYILDGGGSSRAIRSDGADMGGSDP